MEFFLLCDPLFSLSLWTPVLIQSLDSGSVLSACLCVIDAWPLLCWEPLDQSASDVGCRGAGADGNTEKLMLTGLDCDEKGSEE